MALMPTMLSTSRTTSNCMLIPSRPLSTKRTLGDLSLCPAPAMARPVKRRATSQSFPMTVSMETLTSTTIGTITGTGEYIPRQGEILCAETVLERRLVFCAGLHPSMVSNPGHHLR